MKVKNIVCWRCGKALKRDQRPISRLEACRSCGTDLYVCRLCQHYNPRLTSYCSHDHAEPPRERERANFCQYFTPRPIAYTAGREDASRASRARLDALFPGKSPDATPDAPATASRPDSNPNREELDRLFRGSDADNPD